MNYIIIFEFIWIEWTLSIVLLYSAIIVTTYACVYVRALLLCYILVKFYILFNNVSKEATSNTTLRTNLTCNTSSMQCYVHITHTLTIVATSSYDRTIIMLELTYNERGICLLYLHRLHYCTISYKCMHVLVYILWYYDVAWYYFSNLYPMSLCFSSSHNS